MCHMTQTLGRDTRRLYALYTKLRSQISCSIIPNLAAKHPHADQGPRIPSMTTQLDRKLSTILLVRLVCKHVAAGRGLF
jgi:hypothetical protein